MVIGPSCAVFGPVEAGLNWVGDGNGVILERHRIPTVAIFANGKFDDGNDRSMRNIFIRYFTPWGEAGHAGSLGFVHPVIDFNVHQQRSGRPGVRCCAVSADV